MCVSSAVAWTFSRSCLPSVDLSATHLRLCFPSLLCSFPFSVFFLDTRYHLPYDVHLTYYLPPIYLLPTYALHPECLLRSIP